MTKSAPHRRLDILVIAIAGLATALLAGLGMNWYHDRTDRWIRIVSPVDENATEIVALNRVLAPYVRTQQGSLYFCSGGTWSDACRRVTAAELPMSRVHPKWLTCDPPFPETPSPPGDIVDAIETGQCSEARTYGKVILLSDGTLWQWRRSYSWVQPFTIATAAVAGLALGLLIGAFVVGVWRYLRTPPPSNIKAT